jgi:VWFA-related protein
MRFSRFVLLIMLCAAASAQAPSGVTEVPEIDQPIVRTTVTNIVAPVLVTDRAGNIIDGLQPNQFHLFDNGKEQNIQVDQAFEPISLVVAIECSGRISSILTQIKHIGSLVQQTVTGSQGEVAVVAFDGRIRLMQDFTNDPDKIKVAVDKIQPGNTQSRMIDAVDRGVYMLRKRPRNNRKIVLLVSETRDEGSEARLREALIDTNLSNVMVYTVDITQLAVRLTEKQPDPRPVAMDPTAMNAPLGIPNTPTTMEQNYGMGNRVQFTPLLKEIYTDAKGIFVRDPATQFAKSTGGKQFFFLKQKGLEEAVQDISRQLHSHYMLSYRPTDADEGGFHTIEVSIDRSSLICTTRPGYWIGGGVAQ